MQVEIMLGACWEPEVGSGSGEEVLTRIPGEVGEREGPIMVDRISYSRVLFVSSLGLVRARPSADESHIEYRFRKGEVGVDFDSWRPKGRTE